MKYIKSFEKMLREELKVLSQQNININTFKNELTHRETWDLKNFSVKKRFNMNEINDLNLYFSVFQNISNNFKFNVNFGGFGKERINFKGTINKYSEYNMDGSINSDYFLIEGYIKLKLGIDEGSRDINIKLNSLNEIMDFFDDFEKNIIMEY